jgi:hypothetical protein
MYIFVGFIIYCAGMTVGFVIRGWILSKADYDGIINVEKNDGKIVYTLEFKDDPDKIQYMKEVIFKIKTSDESSESQMKHRV